MANQRDQFEVALEFARHDAQTLMQVSSGSVAPDEILKRARAYLDFLQDRGEGMSYPALRSK